MIHDGKEVSPTGFDAVRVFNEKGTDRFAIGVDVNDGYKFKVSLGGALGSNDFVAVEPGGDTGFGTTGPRYRVDVQSPANTPGVSIRYGRNVSGGDYASLIFSHIDGSVFYNEVRSIRNAVSNAFDLAFTQTNFGGGSTEAVRIARDGNVGFGTTGPEDRAHVHDGQIRVTRESDGVFRGEVASNTPWHNPRISLRRSRGTLASPIGVTGNDQLGTLDIWAHDGSGFIRCAGLTPYALDTVATGIVPTTWVLSVMTSTGQLVNTVTVRENRVGVAQASPQERLHIGGNIRVVNGGQVQFPGSAGAISSIRAVGTADLTFRINGVDEAILTDDGRYGVGTVLPTEKFDVDSDAIRLRQPQTPATAGAVGTTGMICWSTGFVYCCVGTNEWKRSALSSW